MPQWWISLSSSLESHSVEGSLQKMDGAVVGLDDELTIGPTRSFCQRRSEAQCELFEYVIVRGVKFVIGK